MLSQTDSGKGFEYALASEVSSTFGTDIVGDAQVAARRAYDSLTDDQRVERHLAAQAALRFLFQRDDRLVGGNLSTVEMQPDNVAVEGDLRDLVLWTVSGEEIGLSAKNRSRTLRNPRISHGKYFGKNWFGLERCSQSFKLAIQPVWDYIEPLEKAKQRWPCTKLKRENIYLPALAAFIDETRQILAEDTLRRTRRMMAYMLGIADYYMIYKQNGDVAVHSFNMHKTLGWGTSMPMPTRMIELEMKPGSYTTAIMVLDAGWQLSFRLHTADRPVKRSLKFDVKVLGQPYQFSNHLIQYR